MRSSYCDKTGLKRGAWTSEEDSKLLDYIKRYGPRNWRLLAKFAGLARCGKSCRLRWMNYLRPNIKRGNYTREEDEIIINLHETLGNRWSAIAAKLPRRTDNEIKNHWHTHLKKHFQRKRSSTLMKEVMLQRAEVSQFKSESETSTSLDNSPRPTILESSSVVLMSIEKTMSHLTSSPSYTKSLTNEIPITDGNILEEFDELSGIFWTEPFQFTETNQAENYTTYEISVTDGNTSEAVGKFSGNFSSKSFQLEEPNLAENYTSNLIDPELLFPPSPPYSSYDAYGMEFYFNHLSGAGELLSQRRKQETLFSSSSPTPSKQWSPNPPRWSAIAAKLPGRTDNEIKNHWHTHLKKWLQRSSAPRKEVMLQPAEVSQCESESETSTYPDNSPRPSILESSSVVSMSIEKTLSKVTSSPSYTKSLPSEITDGNILEEFDKLSGNFWTEPFQWTETNQARNYTTYEISVTDRKTSEAVDEFSGNFSSESFQLEKPNLAENYTSNLIDPELLFLPSPQYSSYDVYDMEFYFNHLSGEGELLSHVF